MRLLQKIRGLWRFDGDEEPVQVSRRSFLFMGGVVAAGLAMPMPPPMEVAAKPVAELVTVDHVAAMAALFKETYREIVPVLFEAHEPFLDTRPLRSQSPSLRTPVRIWRP